ncbi:MAG: 2-isopropylmalate synthase [Patescibacteria group bacterium]|jgi:2-isopropylmalate synthase
MSEDKDWVRIFDTTLRDGEQSPGCTMNVEEKLVVARQLEALGVDVIEAGFAAASPGDFEAVKRVARAVKGPVVLSLARTKEADIERALSAVDGADKPGIHVFIATSDLHLEKKLGMSRQEALDAAVWAVQRCRRDVDYIEFSAEDASRSDIEYLIQVFGAVIAAGAVVCNVPDTTGYAVPVQIRELFRTLRARTPGGDRVIWSTHCHNDLGLAVANSLAAVEGGARQIECTINGIGERAGNTAMDEVVMALRTREDYFGVSTRVRTKHFYPAGKTLSNIVGVPIAPTKPIVGANAFSHEAGIHQDGVTKDVLTYEIMRPEDVGRVRTKLVLGKHSGMTGFIEALKELGINPADIDVRRCFDRLKILADRKKEIYNEDLFAIIDGCDDVPERVRFVHAQLMSRLPSRSVMAVVVGKVDGALRVVEPMGDGIVNVIFRGVLEFYQEINPTAKIILLSEYKCESVTVGADANARVVCLLSIDGQLIRGHGMDTDVPTASAYAFTDALNRFEVRRARATDVERP